LGEKQKKGFMDINENIDLIIIGSKKELSTFYSGISKLFHESFGKPLDKELWEWAYLNNPLGDPLVAIAVHQGLVIGHYAVIPMNLESKYDELLGFLSMTTMVAMNYRKLKLFQRLAEIVYERIQCLGLPSIVYGFPNDHSAPGFKKRLGWVISEEYKVVSVEPHQISSVINVIDGLLDDNYFTLNIDNISTKNWRTAKPNQTWVYDNNIGTKKIGEELDLMHISDAKKLESLNLNTSINMILPIDKGSPLSELSVSFPYRFGYRVFNCEVEPQLFVQMSMSDIF
jgi:hypothetical protein